MAPAQPMWRARRLVARRREERDVLHCLDVVQRAGDAVLVLELHGHERAHDVVGRVLAPGQHVLHEVCARPCRGLLEPGAVVIPDALVDVDLVVGQAADLVEVGVGRAEHRRDDHPGHAGAEVVDEVEAARPDLLVEDHLDELAHVVLDGLDRAGCEGPAHQVAVHRVERWVLGDHRVGDLVVAGANHLEDVALVGAVGLVVDEGVEHVLEARERPEVVLVVAIEGCFFAHPAPGGMGVGVEGVVVGVPREVCRL